VRYIGSNGWVSPGALVVATAIAAVVWMFWLLVFGLTLVAVWAVVAALFGR
jgi:hypothetical protein